MFKFLVLFSVFSLTLARPSYITSYSSSPTTSTSPYYAYASHPGSAIAIHQQTGYATVGAAIKTIPTSVSHSSHSVVHNSDAVVQDVLTPVVRTSAYYAAAAPTTLLRTVGATGATHLGYVSPYEGTPVSYAAASPYATYRSSGFW